MRKKVKVSPALEYVEMSGFTMAEVRSKVIPTFVPRDNSAFSRPSVVEPLGGIMALSGNYRMELFRTYFRPQMDNKEFPGRGGEPSKGRN